MRSLHFLFRLCALCSLLFGADHAHAYEYLKNGTTPIKWPMGKAIEWKLNPDAYTQVPQTQLAQIFQDAFSEWMKIKCAQISFVYRGPTTQLPVRGDSTNVVGFPGNFEVTHGQGIVFVPNFFYNQKNELTEVDVSINPKMGWSLTPTSGQFDLISIATVTAGSLLGLQSSKVLTSTMEGTFYPGAIKKRTLHPDDIAGACFLYPSGQPQCAQDADCPSQLACQQASCVSAPPAPLPNACKPCNTTQDCGAGMTCDFVGTGNFCIQLCNADGLCPSGYSCNGSSYNAQCLPPGFVCKGSTCTKDSDCPSKQKCVNGKCDIVPFCTQDSECNLREICDNGTCKPRPGTCNSDADCKAGERCIGGACNTASGCRQDSDCPAGKFCDNGICKDKTTGCTKDADCPQGQRCDNGTCKTSTTGCVQDTDCPADHVCQNAQCQPKKSCTPGASQGCVCTDGKNGSQSCKSDGSGFEACVCTGPQSCTPNQSRACVCTDGKNGNQTCKSDASGFTDCVCIPTGTCTPNQTIACVCPNGTKTTTCKADGSGFDACPCDAPQACVPGVSQGCVCTDGKNGSQSCNADGKSFGVCTCTGTPPQGCQSAAQCTNGLDCINGICQAKPKTGCTLATDCSAGQNCLNGQCVASGTGKGGCGCQIGLVDQSTESAFWMLLLIGLFLRRRTLRPRPTASA